MYPNYIMDLSRIVILLTSFYTPVDLIGVEFICPTFRDGQNIVLCKINKTAVDVAECDSMQDYVSLEKTVSSRRNPQIINLTQSFVPTDCWSRPKPVPDGCWCTKSNGEIYDYEFAFEASQTKDNGALLECKICNSPKFPFEETVSDNCKRMHFGIYDGMKWDNSGNAIANYSSGILVFASIFAFLIQGV